MNLWVVNQILTCDTFCQCSPLAAWKPVNCTHILTDLSTKVWLLGNHLAISLFVPICQQQAKGKKLNLRANISKQRQKHSQKNVFTLICSSLKVLLFPTSFVYTVTPSPSFISCQGLLFQLETTNPCCYWSFQIFPNSLRHCTNLNFSKYLENCLSFHYIYMLSGEHIYKIKLKTTWLERKSQSCLFTKYTFWMWDLELIALTYNLSVFGTHLVFRFQKICLTTELCNTDSSFSYCVNC